MVLAAAAAAAVLAKVGLIRPVILTCEKEDKNMVAVRVS
jgi:hypothetical protein